MVDVSAAAASSVLFVGSVQPVYSAAAVWVSFKSVFEFQDLVISPDFSLELTGFFQGKHLIHFLVLKMKDFRNFVLDNCILDFDAEQVYLKPQVINLKNNPKP